MDHFLKKALKSDKRQYCYLDLQFEIRYSGEIGYMDGFVIFG